MIALGLKRFRDKLGYSQTGIAESVGMKQTTWSGWENNPPDALEWLVELSRRHGVSIEYILGVTDDPTPIVPVTTGLLGAEQQAPLSVEALAQIAKILLEMEVRAREAISKELTLGAMKYIERWKDVDAAEEFYQAVDLLRRTGDDSALTAWLARYLSDDEP